MKHQQAIKVNKKNADLTELNTQLGLGYTISSVQDTEDEIIYILEKDGVTQISDKIIHFTDTAKEHFSKTFK